MFRHQAASDADYYNWLDAEYYNKDDDTDMAEVDALYPPETPEEK